jgi:uncharacterized protein (TIGR03083 family)
VDHGRLLECLDADYRRLRDVGEGDPTTVVPSCPEWTVADLLCHVAVVYLHKVECIRLGRPPDPWPPDLTDEAPLAVLERAYADLAETFAAHDPSDAAHTWYDPDRSVGFWIRRMAHETVIHRRDAELAFGVPTPAPEDLAEDGIDELLSIFVGWATTKWAHEISEELAAREGDTVLVDGWLLRPTPKGVVVERGGDEAALRVSGSPSSLLFWLWSRAAPTDDAVVVDGDEGVAERFRETLTLSTQ